MHKEFSIAPGGRLSMADFTAFLRETYALPRAAPASLKGKPRLLLIHRGHYRKSAGFEVVALDPRSDARVEELARTVNSFDVLMGVHGAGLTNAVFLPYGKLERMAKVDFGDPVADMGLRYLEYSISAEESTLLEMLGPEHPVIKDPEAVHRSGWDKIGTKLYICQNAVWWRGHNAAAIGGDPLCRGLQQLFTFLSGPSMASFPVGTGAASAPMAELSPITSEAV